MKKKKIIKSGLLSATLLMGTGFAVVNSDNLNLNFWMEVPENSVSVNITFITFGGENYEDESVEYDYSDGLDITFDSSQEYKGGDVWFNMDLGNGNFSVDYKVSLASVTVKDDTNHIYDVESSFVSGGQYEGEEEREPDILSYNGARGYKVKITNMPDQIYGTRLCISFSLKIEPYNG